MYEDNIDYLWPFEITGEDEELEKLIWERVKAKLLQHAYDANAEMKNLSNSPIVVFKSAA